MGSSKNLQILRKLIDELDREMLDLLNRRGEVVMKIRELKKENDVGVRPCKRGSDRKKAEGIEHGTAD
jgi:chorismate mutase